MQCWERKSHLTLFLPGLCAASVQMQLPGIV
ncbi:hypothetical protein Nmel_009939 [Mimus melanotis]